MLILPLDFGVEVSAFAFYVREFLVVFTGFVRTVSNRAAKIPLGCAVVGLNGFLCVRGTRVSYLHMHHDYCHVFLHHAHAPRLGKM